MDLTPYVKDKAIRRRFLKKVQFCEHGKACKQCCWLYTGTLDTHSYGVLSVYRSKQKPLRMIASRFMWTLRYGHTELNVLHTCDNPPCVNYNHLWIGTQGENMQDKTNKGRTPKGEKHRSATLTNEDIYHIFYLRSQGNTQQSIADRLGTSRENVGLILRAKHWKHLSEGKSIEEIRVMNTPMYRKGENSPRTKLTEKDIANIFKLRSEGYVQREIAEQYGVSRETIRSILLGINWKYYTQQRKG